MRSMSRSKVDVEAMMDRAAEIEKTFSYNGYQIVRREMFAHMREPSVVIRKDSITFNTACITGLEDAVYIQIMVNRNEHRMAIRMCEEDDKDSVRWCVAKPDKRKSRKISSSEFSRRMYTMMSWSEKCRYKILGHKIEYEGKTLYVFELDEPEILFERKKRTKADVAAGKDSQDLTPEQIEERMKEEENMPVKPFYPDDWENSFGVPVKEHGNVTLGDPTEYQSYKNMDTGPAGRHGDSDSDLEEQSVETKPSKRKRLAETGSGQGNQANDEGAGQEDRVTDEGT